MFTLKKSLIFTCLIALSSPSNAGIIDLGNITRDTETGLDWLDVTETRGLSFNDVVAQLSPDGAYEGWRYATYSELDELILNFGYVPIITNCQFGNAVCDGGMGVGDFPVIEDMINTLGDTYDAYYKTLGIDDINAVSINGTGKTVGFLGSTFENDKIHLGFIYDMELSGDVAPYPEDDPRSSNYPDQIESIRMHWDLDDSRPDIGSFLVRSSEVPEPSTLAIFALGLIGLASRRVQRL